MMNLEEKSRLKIVTKVSVFNGSCLQIETQLVDVQRDLVTDMSMKVINTQETAIRQGLIALGWTPPFDENMEGL